MSHAGGMYCWEYPARTRSPASKRASCRPRESLSHGVNTGGADLRGDAMRHYSVVVDAYLTARAKTESVTGVHNDSLIGAMVAHKKL